MLSSLLWFLELDDVTIVEFACATGDYSRAFGRPRRHEMPVLIRAVIDRFGHDDAARFGRHVDDYLLRRRATRASRRDVD